MSIDPAAPFRNVDHHRDISARRANHITAAPEKAITAIA
jgi:hypothetical protein